MAYLAAQNVGGPEEQMVSIAESGAISMLTGDENVLYSLGHRKPKLFGEDGLPLVKLRKNAQTQQQIDEAKRREFLQILEEQQAKIKLREIKL